MSLAALQLALRDVLVSRAPVLEPNDLELGAYVQHVLRSGRVPIIAEIIRSWRTYDLEGSCPLTVMALKKSMLWEETVAGLESDSQSPFVELFADHFLEQMCGHVNPMIAGVARLERSLAASVREQRLGL
jgi:hypothetical protein